MARFMRTELGQAHSRLRPPAVVGAGIVFRGVQVTTVAVRTMAEQPRHFARYRLQPPTVVNPPFVFIAEPVRTTLTYSLRGKSKSHLGPGQIDVFQGPQINLAYSRRGRPVSRVFPPVIPPLAEPPRVSLAYSLRGKPKPRLAPPAHVQVEPNRSVQVHLARITPPPTGPRLQPPAVIGQAPFRGLILHLAYSQHGQAKPRLQPPAVVAPPVVEVYYGPQVTLAPSPGQARKPHSVLRPPVIPPLAEPTRVTLTYSSRGQAKPVLSLPAHVQVEPNQPVAVHLTRILPEPTQAVLEPPAVIGQPPFRGIQAHLAYSRRGIPKSRLVGLPTGASDVYTGPRIHLTYSLRGKAQSQLLPVEAGVAPFRPVQAHLAVNKPRPTTTLLEPPAVVQAETVVFTGPQVNLTYSRRGETLWELKPPAVVGSGRVFAGLAISLALFKPHRVSYQASLEPPAVVGKPPFRPIQVTLVTDAQRIRWERYLQRAPHYELRPPVVVRTAQVLYGPLVELAPSRFPKPKSRLRPPAVVGVPPFRPVEITLARNKPRPTTTLLRPPAVTRQPPFRGLILHLAYSRRGRPVYQLRPPAVVAQPPFRGLLTHLTYSRRGEPTSLLKPPTVVNPAEAFYGPNVWLTYQSRGKPGYQLKPPTVTQVFFPGGDICGFDVAASFVCIDETTDTGHKITGGDSPVGRATGSDRKAT